MGANPLLGVVFHWIGGFASATNFIPFREIKRWSWEIYWLIQGIAAWIVAPLLMAMLLVPRLPGVLREAYAVSPSAIFYPLIFGALWGIGGLAFGLAIRYLGIALGYAIALGLSTVFGTLIPPIFHRQFLEILHQTSGRIILAGGGVCLVAVTVNSMAGLSKDREITPEEKIEADELDFSLTKGIHIAVLAGIMSSCFAFGLDAGKPIGLVAKVHLDAASRSPLWQDLPALVVVLWGGFATNLVWSFILILKNRSAGQFLGTPGLNPMRTAPHNGNTLAEFDPEDPNYSDRLSARTLALNYCFASLAGIIWYFQFFFYSMGQTKMGRYEFSSWTLHMASIILFATLWGIFLKAWHGTSHRTKLLVSAGLSLLVGSTLIVGFGDYIQAVP